MPSLKLSVLASLLAIMPVPAQWLDQPTPGIPRNSDGKPNLAAAVPKGSDGKPDFSGLWRLGVEIGIAANLTADLPPADIQPSVAALSLAGVWRISGRTIRKPPVVCQAAPGISPARVW